MIEKLFEVIRNNEEDTWECPYFYYRISFDDAIVLSLVKEDYSPEYHGGTGEDIEMVVSSSVLARFDGSLRDYVNLVIRLNDNKDFYNEMYDVNIDNIIFAPV